MDTNVPLLVFTPRVGNKEHLSTHMKFHTGTIQFRMLNSTEVFFSFQPGLSIVGDCFCLVEELFFKRQCFISAKNNQIYFHSFTDYNELKPNNLKF